jgi:viroplasmin and RNaseH domain-containing protein
MEDNKGQRDEVYSKRIKAGKRTYFIDVKATRGNDFYITITESKRKEDGYGYAKHKIFLYKEDFNKFMDGMDEVIGYVKNDLMPDYDFERYSHHDDEGHDGLDKAVDGVRDLTSVNEEVK